MAKQFDEPGRPHSDSPAALGALLRLAATAAVLLTAATATRANAATLQYDQATGQARLDIGDSPSGKILGYVLTSNDQFFADPLRSTSFGAESAPFYENKPGIIGDNDFAFNGTANSIALGQLFPSTLSSVQELAARFTSRTYVPSLGGGEHRINVKFIDLDGVAWNEPAPAPPLPPVEPPPTFNPVPPPTIDVPSFQATLRYHQATGQAYLTPGESPSGKILGYVLTSNDQFFVDPTRATSFGGESAPFYENKPHIIGDNDLGFQGTSAEIPLGQLFPTTLGSVNDLAASFTNRTYVPSLGGGEHLIKLEYIDLDGNVWDEPAPLPPVVLPPDGPVGPVPPLDFPPLPPGLPPRVETPPSPPLAPEPPADPPAIDIDVGPVVDVAPPDGSVYIPQIIDGGHILVFPDWNLVRPKPGFGHWYGQTHEIYQPIDFILTIDDSAADGPTPVEVTLDAGVGATELVLVTSQFSSTGKLAAGSDFDLSLLTATRTASPAIVSLAGNIATTGHDANLLVPEPAAWSLAAIALTLAAARRRTRR